MKILSDLKLNQDEPNELTAASKGQVEGEKTIREMMENAGPVEMLRAIPGVNGRNVRLVMSKIEGMGQLVGMKQKEMKEVLGEEKGETAWRFVHLDSRVEQSAGVGVSVSGRK